MELSKECIASLEQLLAASPELCRQIEQAPDADRAAELLLHAARNGGVAIELTAARAYIAQSLHSLGKLNAEALDAITAGWGGVGGIAIGTPITQGKGKS